MHRHGVLGYDSKSALLRSLVQGRTVVHLGAVGETCQHLDKKLRGAERSVHALLTEAASECVGIDVDREGVEAWRAAGYFDNLMVADATTLRRSDIPLERVDVIVAGDVIEHLSSPGDLLDAASAISDPGTRLVLTTPNALGLVSFVRYLRGSQLEGPDHKVSFNVYSMRNLLRTHGWQDESISTCYQSMAARTHGRLALRAGIAAFKRFPALGGTLLVVARRVGDPPGPPEPAGRP
jgi:SAM-dependent methyltransferase